MKRRDLPFTNIGEEGEGRRPLTREKKWDRKGGFVLKGRGEKKRKRKEIFILYGGITQAGEKRRKILPLLRKWGKRKGLFLFPAGRKNWDSA